MKTVILFCVLILLMGFPGCTNNVSHLTNEKHTLQKENGKIILAHEAFFDFLASDKSWEHYQSMLLDAYPELQLVHQKQLDWGGIDSATFPAEVANYKNEDWEKFRDQYSHEDIHALYDSIILTAHSILAPIDTRPVNLCLFLPYGSCFIEPGDDASTIYISMHIHPGDVHKIMAHEYGHHLHFQRRPEETQTLQRELVSEGFAVYISALILDGMDPFEALPFMPKESVDWCFENEQMIKDALYPDLQDTTHAFMYKYIADGDFATPPEGFVQKTAYFAGCRVIESCIKAGLTLEDISSMSSVEIIEASRYFH